MVLKNGMVVFIAEDRALPLVNIALTVRVGSWLEPAGKEGLAGFTGSQMRRGGTQSLTAEELDEKLDFLAAQVSTGIGRHLGLRQPQLPLRQPRRGARGSSWRCCASRASRRTACALAKEQALQEMKKRNDDSADIEAREWNVLLYGADHFTNRFTTEASRRGDHARRPRWPSTAGTSTRRT